jgi:hypothetical protein
MNYEALWPIIDPAVTAQALAAEAQAELLEMADAERLRAAGDITFHRTAGYLSASVPVVRETVVGDPRPWESRDAYVDDVFDLVAA